MSDIKRILENSNSIAMIGVSSDLKKNFNHSHEIYARVWLQSLSC